MTDYKRPKTLESKTENIKTDCGTLNFTKGYDNGKLVEIWAVIGRSGTCSNSLLASFCKVVSMYLQSAHPRYKIVKKFKKQFIGSNCGMPFYIKEDKEQVKYCGCIDWIAQNIVEEIDK